MSYWYCPNCKEELGGNHVTHQELCDYCGTRVLWRDEGISPERLEEILQAEKEGRLIVLPCKVGDTVYAPFCGKVYRETIDKIIINRFTTPQIWIETKLPFVTSRLERWDMAIGKTVFLTREEAEAALSKAGDSE